MTTPQEFYDQMLEIQQVTHGDPHDAHSIMDCRIIELLKELGYQDGAAVFESQDKWYE